MTHQTRSRRSLSRRHILLGSTAAVGLTALGSSAVSVAAQTSTSTKLRDPFTLGVASGDPEPDSVVLWTRLAESPLADDGLGGMPNRAVSVDWELATDERFQHVVRRGTTDATPDAAHSVHVVVNGLQPGADYYYRFRTQGNISPSGHTKTAPAPGTSPTGMTMCFASCNEYEHGFFTAYRRMAEEEPDLMMFLGDYIYEYEMGHYVPHSGSGFAREILGPRTQTLANYRQRYAQYKTDPDLQAAHATAPWIVTLDDHEVSNDWAVDIALDLADQDRVPLSPERRAAALKAFFENMPIRPSARLADTSLQLYRRLRWGDLVTMHMIDTRQYRDHQPCGSSHVVPDCGADRLDPAHTILGAEQEQWLVDGFHRSRATWDVLGNQVFFSQVDYLPGPGTTLKMDTWDGYPADRDRIVAAMSDSGVRNPVVLTGDIHTHLAAEVKADFNDPESRTVAPEFVVTSITSNGDGFGTSDEATLTENPHVKYDIDRRGYIRTRFTGNELRADYQIVPFVSRPGAPVQTAATFVVEDQDPSLHRV